MTVLDRLRPALPLSDLKTTREGPEEKEGGKKVSSDWRSLAPITTEGRKADHLRGSQSESGGREHGTAQAVLFIKHTPTN